MEKLRIEKNPIILRALMHYPHPDFEGDEKPRESEIFLSFFWGGNNFFEGVYDFLFNKKIKFLHLGVDNA